MSSAAPARDLPVLFFQAGDARHLPYTFWQAKHWAGGSPLILLGDESNRHYRGRGLEHVPIRDFASAVSRLRDLYVHISSNTAEFEFFCLARWLVMEEFARRQGLREFLYLDCDVLLFEAPASLVARVPACALALSWYGDLDPAVNVACPAVTLVRNSDELAGIKESIFAFYQNRPEVECMQLALAGTVRQRGGGLSDMWFLARAIHSRNLPVFNLGNPVREGTVDINMFRADGFRCRDGLKEIVFREGRPHGFYEPESRWIRFATLHFVGASKKSMGRFLGRPGDLSLVRAQGRERLGKGLGWHKASAF